MSPRTAEIGVRMAFGAPARTRALGTALVHVSATDPLTYGTIAAGFLVIAVLACGLPARRASRLDPLAALRQE